MGNLEKDLKKGIDEVTKDFIAQKEKNSIELEYVIRLKVPSNFSGVDPWGRIETIEDYMNHW